MNKTNAIILGILLGAVLFTMGWAMGLDHYKQKLIAAMKAKDNQEAAKLLYERQQSGADVMNDPLFWIAKAVIHLRNGNNDVALTTFDKALDLLGK